MINIVLQNLKKDIREANKKSKQIWFSLNLEAKACTANQRTKMMSKTHHPRNQSYWGHHGASERQAPWDDAFACS